MANWSPPPRWLLAVLKKRWSTFDEVQVREGKRVPERWWLGCRDRERVIPPLFFRVCPNTVEPRTDVVAIYSWRRALLDLFSPDRKIQAVDPNGSLERGAAGRRKREREREMASGSEREEQSGAREIRRTEAEEARENLERCFKSKEKGNGLIIMLSTALFN